jgi:hypothetical protein
MNAYLMLIISAAFASCCLADEISVVVTNIPANTLPFRMPQESFGMPQEARKVSSHGTPHVLGKWGSFLTNAVQATIRFYDKQWASDDKGAKERLIALFSDERTEVWGQIVWANDPTYEPTAEGTMRYRNGKECRFILWKHVGCFQDAELKWYFLVLSSMK